MPLRFRRKAARLSTALLVAILALATTYVQALTVFRDPAKLLITSVNHLIPQLSLAEKAQQMPNTNSGRCGATVTSTAIELGLKGPHLGWAEQYPGPWWQEVVAATTQLRAAYCSDPMLLVGKAGQVLRSAIIWPASRAGETGNNARQTLGKDFCLDNFLNSPGNFTASKLKWVREDESETYARIHKAVLPGNYLAFRLTGELQTTVSGLSEGVFRNFNRPVLAQELLDCYGIGETLTTAPRSQLNSFVHIDGTGISNSWLRRSVGELPHDHLNHLAARALVGAAGLRFLPFGNGADNVRQKSGCRKVRQERYASFDASPGVAFAQGRLTPEDLRRMAHETG